MDKDMIAIRIGPDYQWLLLAHRIIFLAEVFQRHVTINRSSGN